jgi:uncharacterized membrane protein YfcA
MGVLADGWVRKCLLTGFGIGILSGLLGVGGGIFLVPVLVSYFNLEQHKAQAVSLAVVLPTAIISSIIYGYRGQVNIQLAVLLAIGGTVGAAAGARVMPKIPAATLKRLFGLLLCVVGVRMLWPW